MKTPDVIEVQVGLTGPQGPPGAQGPPGPMGPASTVPGPPGQSEIPSTDAGNDLKLGTDGKILFDHDTKYRDHVPYFATTAERDAAIPNPVAGQRANVAGLYTEYTWTPPTIATAHTATKIWTSDVSPWIRGGVTGQVASPGVLFDVAAYNIGIVPVRCQIAVSATIQLGGGVHAYGSGDIYAYGPPGVVAQIMPTDQIAGRYVCLSMSAWWVVNAGFDAGFKIRATADPSALVNTLCSYTVRLY